MKNIIVAFILLVCAGCTQVPVKPEFPKAPNALMEECKPLKTIDKPKVVMSELMTTVTENYTEYYVCATKVTAWQEWYNKQKKIYK